MEALVKSLAKILPRCSYVVGGFVRDLLLGRAPRDIDLVVAGRAWDAACRVAEETGGRVVVLDEKRNQVRVVLPHHQLDINGLNGNTLEQDLRRRDFTINAIAVPLACFLSPGWPERAIDPLEGKKDLLDRVLRPCSHRAYEDDPLRVLRGLRLKEELGFKFDPAALGLMQELKKSFTPVAGERLWEELRRLLELPHSSGIFVFLDRETKILPQVFPPVEQMRIVEQNGYHVDNVWEHCLNTLACFERQLADGRLGEVQSLARHYLQGRLGRERLRLPVVKLACLFHDVGKIKTSGRREDGRITFYNHHFAGGPLAVEIGRRLKMSRKEIRLLRLLVEQHMQPLFLYKQSPPASRAVARFLLRLGEEALGCLLLSLADVTSSRLSSGRNDLAEQYTGYILALVDQYRKVVGPEPAVTPLLSGREICLLLGIEPSPLVGKLKAALLEAQLAGKVVDRRGAVFYLRKIYQNFRKKEKKK